ncbi:peptide deformylase [Planktotalea arctica]|uniref:peptide deformylase n=1 Tax=Planktotalea arctica TaxID=1481893 RepID=UPI00321A7985
MSVLPIVAWPDPRLKRICSPVDRIDDAERRLIDDMFETMYAAPGRGLAAPQVGVMQRLFVMDATWKEGVKTPLACINPKITVLGEAMSTNEEACLSIVGVAGVVTRPDQIELSYTDIEGARGAVVLTGFAAICAQHEMDHLDGRVIFDHLDVDARAALEAEYRGLAQ